MKKILNAVGKWADKYENAPILIILALFILGHLYIMITCGIEFSLRSDDLSYVNAGIRFAETGELTMHGVITAQIMPGMPVLIGGLAALFGKGKALWAAVKVLWLLFGCGTLLFAYHTAILFVPKKAAALASLIFLTPDIAALCNLPLSETPYMFFLTASLYLAAYAGKTGSKAAVSGMLATVLTGFMIRANILPFACVAVIYLALKKFPIKQLAVRVLAAVICLSLFIVPWVIRNHSFFGDYIVSYGTYNPMYVGTQQGYGYPDDSEIDFSEEYAYVQNLTESYLESHPEYDELPDYMQRYYDHTYNKLQAKKRISVWFKKDPASLILSYAVLKPKQFFESYKNYADRVFIIRGYRRQVVYRIYHDICFLLCCISVFIGLKRKRYRSELFLFGGTYLINMISFSIGCVLSRYEIPLTAFKAAMLALLFGFLLNARGDGLWHKFTACLKNDDTELSQKGGV